MAQNRPITRSLLTKTRHDIEDAEVKGRALSELQIVNKWIHLKAYEQALRQLAKCDQQQHWVHCKRGQVEITLKKFREAFRSLEKSFTFKRKGCIQCLEQLINLMERSKSSRQIVDQLIKIAAQREELPAHVRDKVQAKKHQITPKYQVTARQLDSNFHAMLQYYEEAGAKFRKVEVKEVEKDFRIAVAKRTIKPHQTIISIPEQHIITLEKVKRDPQIRLLHINDNRLKSPKHCMLSVYLLKQVQLGQQSPYCSYIKCLPKQIKNFPVKYPKSLLAELEGTTFLESLINRKEDIEQDFKTVKSILGEKSHISLQKFIWARMLVSSRIFGIVVHGVKTDALVPLADMLNHKIPKMTTWCFCDDKNSFIVQNLEQSILQGQQIFDSYGNKCNSRFLLNYGFVQPNNLSNQVFIAFKPYKNKKNAPCYRISMQIMSDQFKQVLSYYRQAVEEENSPDKKRFGLKLDDYQYFISDENQLQVWKYIKTSMKERMSNYKTSIKIDQKLLNDSEQMSFNMRNCIEVRLGQKKILDFYLNMSKTMVEYFSGKKEGGINEIVYEPYLAEIGDHHRLPSPN